MPISFLGLALLNTFIGLENINRNGAQYAKQKIANEKIDRILELLEEKDGNNMDLHRYIEKLDSEISALIEKESVTATTEGERNLHYLFENRKHAKKWAEEKHSDHNPGTNIPAENPRKSYFGGA